MMNYVTNSIEIKFLYSRLTIDDKNKLLDLMIEDEDLKLRVEYDEILISDWLEYYIQKEYISISTRLFNCLYSVSRCGSRYEKHTKYLNEIEKGDILSIENAGKKCWEEFQKLRDDYNKSIKKQ